MVLFFVFIILLLLDCCYVPVLVAVAMAARNRQHDVEMARLGHVREHVLDARKTIARASRRCRRV